jgi:hypothetical protein
MSRWKASSARATIATTTATSRPGLACELLLSDFGRTQFDLDGTVKDRQWWTEPAGAGRARHTWGLTETTQARFTQTAFWEREDGVGTSSRADWEWLPSSKSLVRLTGRGTVSEGSDGVDWRGALVGFRQLNRRTAIRSEIGAFGHTRPTRHRRVFRQLPLSPHVPARLALLRAAAGVRLAT